MSEDTEGELESRRGRRKAKWRLGVRVVVAMILVGAPIGAVAVSQWSADSGEFGGSGSEVADSSEWIAIHADDAPAEIEALYPSYLELPPGATEQDVIGHVSEKLETLGGADSQPLMQTTAIDQFFENGARCLWYRYWLYADEKGDQTKRDQATSGIQRAVTWPAVASHDGGGVVDYLGEQAEAAAAGDREMMIRFYGRSCDDYGRIFT